jgi:hypothetical protein
LLLVLLSDRCGEDAQKVLAENLERRKEGLDNLFLLTMLNGAFADGPRHHYVAHYVCDELLGKQLIVGEIMPQPDCAKPEVVAE